MMSFERALGFRMRNGKTLRETTANEWQEEVYFWRAEVDRMKRLNPATMTEADKARMRAAFDRHREFGEAVEVVLRRIDDMKGMARSA